MDQGSKAMPRRRGPGRPQKFDEAALVKIKQVVEAHPLAPVTELLAHVEEATGIRSSRLTLFKAFERIGIVRVTPPKRPRKAKAAGCGDADESPKEPARYGYQSEHRTSAPSARHALGVSDAEWELVRDIFEDKVRGRPRKYPRRDMLDAMLYVLRGGISWRMLPSEYPPWHLVFKTFKRWESQGRFQRASRRVGRMWRERIGRNAEPTGAILDSQSVSTSAQGGPKGYDAAKKIKGRKRHLLTDTLGLLLAVVVHVASIQDRDGADDVVRAGLKEAPTVRKIYADGGYAGRCRLRLEADHEDLRVEIVRRSNNRNVGRRMPKEQALLFEELPPPSGFEVLPKRWVIERTNGWNLRWRRLTRDQDRTIASAEAWVWLAGTKRVLGRLCRRQTG